MDIRNFIAQTIRTADGNNTMGAGALADAIVDALGDVEAKAALAERVRAVAEVRAMADEIRRDSYTPSAGVALGAVVDSVADRINTMPELASD